MLDLKDQQVAVIGLGNRGRAACSLLRRAGAVVTALDEADGADVRRAAEQLRGEGVDARAGAKDVPAKGFILAVVSPAIPSSSPLIKAIQAAKIPLIGELELGYQFSRCLNVAIAGTNGKGTTAEMIERFLLHHHRKIISAGHGAQPICAVADQTQDLDFLVLQVNAFQLERIQFFRPAVAVVLNLAPDHLDRFTSAEEHLLANARLFENQQAFDWAIVQSEALAQLNTLGIKLPSKVVTFSATDSSADIHLDRGLIISRLGDWQGPALDMAQCRLRGPHNAENIMAAIAVGHALRVPLETTLETLKTETHAPHRFELVAEVEGVQFVNDSKARNVHALRSALLAAPPGEGGKPNIWLIAGGVDRNTGFHDVGPLISARVKGAFLIGQAREKIRSAWSLFTPCTLAGSLLEAVAEAAKNASPGDVVLLSPACSSFDEFQDYQDRGERFCAVVKSISRGGLKAAHNMIGD